MIAKLEQNIHYLQTVRKPTLARGLPAQFKTCNTQPKIVYE
jgi:hypothetical protein